MSNLAFITTPKYIKSYDMYSLLMDINYDRFGKNLSVMSNPPDEWWRIDWISLDPPSSDGFEFLIKSPKKLSVKPRVNPYTNYVIIVYKHELAKRMGGKLSDESQLGCYNPTPEKYSSYHRWLELKYDYLEGDKGLRDRDILMDLKSLPKELKIY